MADRPRIAVIGSSGPIGPTLSEAACAVGRAVALGGGLLLSGGRDGVMEAASRGAHEAGGLVVGILPWDDPASGNPHLDVPLTTGVGSVERSLVLVRSADALVMLGGAAGTLLELVAAYHWGKPVVVLPATGGWAGRLPAVAIEGRYLDERRTVELRYADTPAAAGALALSLARRDGRAAPT